MDRPSQSGAGKPASKGLAYALLVLGPERSAFTSVYTTLSTMKNNPSHHLPLKMEDAGPSRLWVLSLTLSPGAAGTTKPKQYLKRVERKAACGTSRRDLTREPGFPGEGPRPAPAWARSWMGAGDGDKRPLLEVSRSGEGAGSRGGKPSLLRFPVRKPESQSAG